jgi:hypothetical protein
MGEKRPECCISSALPRSRAAVESELSGLDIGCRFIANLLFLPAQGIYRLSLYIVYFDI